MNNLFYIQSFLVLLGYAKRSFARTQPRCRARGPHPNKRNRYKQASKKADFVAERRGGAFAGAEAEASASSTKEERSKMEEHPRDPSLNDQLSVP